MKCRHYVKDAVEEVMVYEEDISSEKRDEVSEDRNCTAVWTVA
jgi:hypothetical protein